MKLCPECLLCLRRVRTAGCELRHGFAGAGPSGHGQQLWLRQRPPQWSGQCLRGGEIRWHATLAERAHAPPSPEGHGYEQELQGALPAMAEPALKETVKHTDRQKDNSQQADIQTAGQWRSRGSPLAIARLAAWRALLGSGPHLRLGESRLRRTSRFSGMPTVHWRMTSLQLPGIELEGPSFGGALL